MKNKLILVFVFFCFQFSFGQDNNLIEINSDELIGIWHLKTSNWRNKELIFVKNTNSTINYGTKIEIFGNGDFNESYSAPCGNDTNRHYSKGKWYLNTKELIFITTIPISSSGTKFKILELKSNQLILKILKTEKP